MPRPTPGPLKPEGAFLVQLREPSTTRRLTGRIEHVVSGESEQFASLTALVAFMTRHTPRTAEAQTPEPTTPARRRKATKQPALR